MAVSFKEFNRSPIENYALDSGMTATRRFGVAWSDRNAFVNELLGDNYEFGGLSQSQYPDRIAVRVVRVRVEPFTSDVEGQSLTDIQADLNTYTSLAVVTVEYGIRTADMPRAPSLPAVPEGTYVEYSLDFGVEQMDLPGLAFTWTDQPAQPVDPQATPSIIVPLLQHRLTWHRVTNPPWTAIRDASGTVNNASFLGVAAESLLFAGAQSERVFTGVDGHDEPQFAWRLVYTFQERTINYTGNTYGWNHTYRSLPNTSPGFDKLVDANGENPYGTSTFTDLFDFDTE